jgi:hypothetical protein
LIDVGEGQQHVGDLHVAIASVTAELRNIRNELVQAREDRKLFTAHMQEMERIKVIAEQHEENQGKFHRAAEMADAHERTLVGVGSRVWTAIIGAIVAIAGTIAAAFWKSEGGQ